MKLLPKLINLVYHKEEIDGVIFVCLNTQIRIHPNRVINDGDCPHCSEKLRSPFGSMIHYQPIKAIVRKPKLLFLMMGVVSKVIRYK